MMYYIPFRVVDGIKRRKYKFPEKIISFRNAGDLFTNTIRVNALRFVRALVVLLLQIVIQKVCYLRNFNDTCSKNRFIVKQY